MKQIKNINSAFGDSVSFDSLREMEQAIENCGYSLPGDGLREGRDYEVINI